MQDQEKTTDQLLEELRANRRRLAQLERLEEELERTRAALRESQEQNCRLREGVPDAALLQERYLLHCLMDHIPDTIYFKSCDGEFLRVNRAKAERHGLRDPRDAVGKTDFDYFAPEFARQAFADELAVMESGRPLVGKEEKLTWPDGRSLWVSTTKVPFRDQQGQLIGTFGISRDISRSKQAEEALRASEERYRLLFERHLAGVVRTRPDGTILDCNEAFARLLGYAARAEVLAHKAGDFYYQPADRQEPTAELLVPGKPTSCEICLRRKDGRPVWVLAHISRVDGEAGAPVLQGIYIDITERKHLEEQLRQAQKMEAVGRLAGGVAHDFNNLLTVITGHGDMLLEGLHPGDARYLHAQQIRYAADRAAGLTRQLLAFGRKQILAPKVLDLNAFLLDMGQMLGRLIGEDIELVTTLAPDLGRIKADPGQLHQVVMNLVVNARDAMPQGGTLTIATANIDTDARSPQEAALPPGAWVLLTIRDTGGGMTEEVRSHLFEPFFTTKEVGKGTGLGLCTSYGILKQSGGHVEVDSAVGRGTIFRIYLPRVDAAVSADGLKTWLAAVPHGTETVLLVEDEELVRTLTRTILKQCGYTVLEAAHGPAALALARAGRGPLHLMVTDVVMPHMSGRELAEHLAPLFPKLKVLYMSGHTDDAVVRYGIQEERTAFLQKPFLPEVLACKVREVLDR